MGASNPVCLPVLLLLSSIKRFPVLFSVAQFLLWRSEQGGGVDELCIREEIRTLESRNYGLTRYCTTTGCCELKVVYSNSIKQLKLSSNDGYINAFIYFPKKICKLLLSW